MKRTFAIISLSVLLASPSAWAQTSTSTASGYAPASSDATMAVADPEPDEDDGDEVFPVSIGLEVGLLFPQLVSDLGLAPTFSVELAFLLPFLEQRLAIFASGSYQSPSTTVEGSDPRLATGAYTYDVTEQELLLTFGPLYRFKPPKSEWNVYGQAGLQVHLQKVDVDGGAGVEPFGVNDETDTKLGMLLAFGAEYGVGPGALAAELAFAFSDLDHEITGDTTAGGLSLVLGYHLLF